MPSSQRLPPSSFPLVMERTPVPPTRPRGITAPRAPCPALPPVRWVGLDPAPPHPPLRPPPPHSKYSNGFPSHLIQAKVTGSFVSASLPVHSVIFMVSFRFSVSALRFCHHRPALATVPTNGANRPPSSSGRAALRARPPLQAAVPQERSCYYEQQLHLQHVPPAASGQELRLSEQQGDCQSR